MLKEVQPLFGPRAGGTRLTLKGQGLSVGTSQAVLVNGTECLLERYVLAGKGMRSRGPHPGDPSPGGTWIPVRAEGGQLSHIVRSRKKGLLPHLVQRWFGDGKRDCHKVHRLQPRREEPVPSLSWSSCWDCPVLGQTHGVWAGGEMTNRGTGRQTPGGSGPRHHLDGDPEPSPPVLQGHRRAAFMYHAAQCYFGQCSRSPAGGGRRGSWLLDLRLPGRPRRAGHQPQLWLHVSTTSFPALVS